jgi:hypothetical protein
MSEGKIDELVGTLAQLKATQKEIAEQIDQLNKSLIELLEASGDEYENEAVRAIIVRSTSSSWDTDVLRELIPAGVWPHVTDRVISDEKLSAAVNRGSVTMSALEQALVIKDRKPYVKITPKLQSS